MKKIFILLLLFLPINIFSLEVTSKSAILMDEDSGRILYAKNIDECIAVDVSFGYTPGCDKEDCGEIGKGVMIGYSPILDRENSNVLKNVALECNIPFQQEIMNGRTGTNADVISVCENGIKCSLLSIPLKYMHTPVEVVKVDDVNSVSDLITAYVKKKVGELNA